MSHVYRALRAAVLALTLCLTAAPARAQDDDDRPAFAVPAWARQVYQLVEDEAWDDALRALAALARTRNNEFIFHYLTAEAAIGKFGEVTEPAAERRLLRSAHAALLRAARLAPPNARADVASSLELVNEELADRGWSAAETDATAAAPNAVTPNAEGGATAPDGGSLLARVCVPGAKLQNFSAGVWQNVFVLGGPTGDGKCNVRGDNAPVGWDRNVGLDRLRARGAAEPFVVTPRASDELKLGEYVCTYRGEIRPIFGFKVLPGHRYTDLRGGNAGTYEVDVRARTVTFRGGSWEGASGADAWGDGFWRVDPDGKRRYHCIPIR